MASRKGIGDLDPVQVTEEGIVPSAGGPSIVDEGQIGISFYSPFLDPIKFTPPRYESANQSMIKSYSYSFPMAKTKWLNEVERDLNQVGGGFASGMMPSHSPQRCMQEKEEPRIRMSILRVEQWKRWSDLEALMQPSLCPWSLARFRKRRGLRSTHRLR